jgi:hypothetical protein
MGQTQKVEVTRKCDVCGHSVVLIQGQITPEQLEASAGWYVVSREHVIGVDQLMPIAKLACTKACVRQLLNGDYLELPAQFREQEKAN